MGNYKSKHKNVDNTKLPRLYPEPDYIIKTRSPTCEGNTWKQNVQLKIRQEQLNDEAMPIARRKCYEPSMEYLACTQREGLFWMVFNCQEQFHYVAECQEHQFYVQMDKKRRDMKRNPEPWWRELYDQNGEIGRQKEMQFGEMDIWDSLKMTFLGESAVEEKRYYYGKPEWFKKKEDQTCYNKMDPTMRQRMEALQSQGEQLQREAKYRQALDKYQEILQFNKNYFGTDSDEYERVSIKMCELCNLISMIFLQKDKFDLCLVFLQKAEAFSCSNPKYLAITLNNKACYYRKTGKMRTALQCLQEALTLEWKSKKDDTLADTYLNLCAVLSQLGRHKQALQNVLFSVTLLQEQILGENKVPTERLLVLAIAYHNMAVQLEHLERFEQSIAIYQKGLKFAQKNLGEQNGLTEKLRAVLANAKECQQNKKVDKNRVRLMSRERMERMDNNDKLGKMKSAYIERPGTAGKLNLGRR